MYGARYRCAGRLGIAYRARRTDVGADHGGAAAHSPIRGEPETRCLAAIRAEDVGITAEFWPRTSAARPDAWHLGIREDRPVACRLRQGLWHESDGVGTRKFAGRRARGRRSSGGKPRGAVRAK